MLYDECFLLSDNNTRMYTHLRKGLDSSFSTVSIDTHFDLFNIFSEKNIHE